MSAVHLRGALFAAVLIGAAFVSNLAPSAAALDCSAARNNPIPLENVNGLVLVNALADGAALRLILDTGAERTILTSSAAERIGGKAPPVQFQRQLKGVAAAVQGRDIEFKSLTIGGIDIPWRRAMVAPTPLPPALLGADGFLGTDVLGKFDIDLDLPHQRMWLYERGTCVPNWTDTRAKIDIGRSAINGHMFFPVQLDRRKVVATIDTGADRTTLSIAAAHAMGLTDAVLARDRPGITKGFGGGQLTSRIHRFASLAVGNITLSDPEIVVTDLRLRGIDLILGMDFLRSRRLFLSYANFRLFLSTSSAATASKTAAAR
ncbi:MAG: aspartyl protease family protein [Alphaproteobacteria bacterium]